MQNKEYSNVCLWGEKAAIKPQNAYCRLVVVCKKMIIRTIEKIKKDEKKWEK